MLQKRRGVKMDKDLSIKLYKQSALCGDETSIYNYAHMLLQGENIGKKYWKSCKVFKNRFSFNGWSMCFFCAMQHQN